jgi:hypothetical protein
MFTALARATDILAVVLLVIGGELDVHTHPPSNN